MNPKFLIFIVILFFVQNSIKSILILYTKDTQPKNKFNFLTVTENEIDATKIQVHYEIPTSYQKIMPKGFNTSKIEIGNTIDLLWVGILPPEFNVDIVSFKYTSPFISNINGNQLSGRIFYHTISLKIETEEDKKMISELFEGLDINQMEKVTKKILSNIKTNQMELEDMFKIDNVNKLQIREVNSINEEINSFKDEIQKNLTLYLQAANKLGMPEFNIESVLKYPKLLNILYNYDVSEDFNNQNELKRPSFIDNNFPYVLLIREMGVGKSVTMEEINEESGLTNRIGQKITITMRQDGQKDIQVEKYVNEDGYVLPERHQEILFTKMFMSVDLQFPGDLETVFTKDKKDPENQIFVLSHILEASNRNNLRVLI